MGEGNAFLNPIASCHPGFSLFIQEAVDSPLFFFSVVITVVISIVLHELAHGFAALWQGDETPRARGHITLDPLVHMGGYSLVMLLLVGIAWGQTPVTPSRFRSRYGRLLVSGAGPAVNILLALMSLTLLGLGIRLFGQPSEAVFTFVMVFGMWNLVLCLFNLVPIPPLDGSEVLADLVPAYRRLMNDPNNRGVFLMMFLVLFFFLANELFAFASRAATAWLSLFLPAAG